MGAYLSQPKTEKVSTDESNDYLSVGASSMQGWRNSQEDAHNSILNFDTNTAFFAVYDGHGGAEVSTYCADKLPIFLKDLAAYLDGNYEQALIDAFLGFDKTLLEPEVIEMLKILAGEKNFVDGDESDVMEDDDDEDLAELHEEGNLPLDEVMEKYKGHPSMQTLKKLKDSNSSKPQSPYLRGRRAAAVIADAANRAELDPDSKPEGSSTSKAALVALQDDPTSSKSSSSSNKVETEEDSTVSSSSSSASKSNSRNVISKSSDDAEAVSTASTSGEILESAINGRTPDGSVPDSSDPKENEQNGSVSSSQVKKNDVPTTSTTKMEATVSGSSDLNKHKSNVNKHNGNVESSTKSPAKQEANSTAITSTSKSKKKAQIGEDDDDLDFDENESNARQAFEYSSEDEELGEDDTTDEDVDYDEDEVEEDDEVDDEEDEESYLANEQFCANMIEEPGKDSGCTAVVGLLNGRDLYVANAGDSRCVVCRNGKAIEMSLDHKPEDDEESTRIIKAGGRVTLDGRVNGGLNLSRALGDHAYKMNHDLPAEEQMISALPDVKKLIISDDDEFMVLACDGIWNFMTSEEVVDFVRLRINDENKKISEICEELFDACLAPNTLGDGTGCDNMTAVIVRFKPPILKLPTKININETEDVLSKQEADSGQKAIKRAASPTSDENDSNEAENKTKRLKTDEEEERTSSTSPKTNSTPCSNMPTNSTASTNEESSITTDSKELEKECDSAVASST